MTDRRDLVRRYLRQQMSLGQCPVVLPHPLEVALPPGPSAGPAPGAADHAAPDAPVAAARAGGSPRRGAAGRGGSREQKRWNVDLPPIPSQGIVVPAPDTDLFARDPLGAASFDDLVAQIKVCTRCRLHASRTHAVPGEGPADARLVVVGEGPGANEDAQGRPFVGRAGDLLNEILAAIDCPRETVYIANVVKCRPPDNRKPQGDEAEACMPYLHRQLALIRPKVILAMGATAAEALLQTRASLGQLRNRVHEYRRIPLVVTYHPAALLRNPNWKRPTWDDVRIARQLLDR